MKKELIIFKRKIPLILILMTLLVVGTASAAVYSHYATMMGNVSIESPISIIVDDQAIEIGETHTLIIENIISPCTISKDFDFNNTYGSPLEVSVLWILHDKDAPLPLDASTSYWVYDSETVLVPIGTSTFTASLDVPSYMIGDHTFRIDVNPVY